MVSEEVVGLADHACMTARSKATGMKPMSRFVIGIVATAVSIDEEGNLARAESLAAGAMPRAISQDLVARGNLRVRLGIVERTDSNVLPSDGRLPDVRW